MTARRLVPGLAALALCALLARVLAELSEINHLLLAVGIGAVVANAVGVPERFKPGVATHKLWLGAGIVLMGASVTVDPLVAAGPTVLLVVVTVTGATMLLVEALTRDTVADRFGSLLAAGSGICGVSAVVAVAGAVRARETHVAYAAATILLFDAVTIVVYPVVGSLLGLSDVVFGVWAGVSMFSTGPVVAVGFAHSETAGQWATMTKLARNALIGVVVLAYASRYADAGGRPGLATLWREFPKFVVGFLALVALASLGVFTADQRVAIENAYNWLFLLAFVGLGTEIRLDELRSAGVTPVLVVFAALLFASVASLALLTAIF